MPGVRLHADTPRGLPLLTGRNPTVYWYRTQPTPDETARGNGRIVMQSFPNLHLARAVFCAALHVFVHPNMLIRELVGVCVCVQHNVLLDPPPPPSSGRPNIAQRRKLHPLLACLAPFHPIFPHSAARIHPFLPCLFSKGTSSFAKYMLRIIFHSLWFKDVCQFGFGIVLKTKLIKQRQTRLFSAANWFSVQLCNLSLFDTYLSKRSAENDKIVT